MSVRGVIHGCSSCRCEVIISFDINAARRSFSCPTRGCTLGYPSETQIKPKYRESLLSNLFWICLVVLKICWYTAVLFTKFENFARFAFKMCFVCISYTAQPSVSCEYRIIKTQININNSYHFRILHFSNGDMAKSSLWGEHQLINLLMGISEVMSICKSTDTMPPIPDMACQPFASRNIKIQDSK